MKIKTFNVTGSTGNKYIITDINGNFSCNCKSFLFRGRCKHIEIAKVTNNMPGTEKDKKKIDEKVSFAATNIKKLRDKILIGSTTNRNRLINYKHNDKRRDQVRIVDELPNQVFERLSNGNEFIFRSLPEPDYEPKDEKTKEFIMALEKAKKQDEVYLKELEKLGKDYDEISKEFQEIERDLKDRVRKDLKMKKRATPEVLGVIEYAKKCNINPDFNLPKLEKEISEDHNDKYLQTILLPEQLDRKLIFIKRTARKALNEKGVDTLCLAIGFLEWFESSKSDIGIVSPLLLLPVTLEEIKKKTGSQFEINGNGNDLEVNLVLKAKLQKDFGLILPEVEENQKPEDYFEKLTESIKSRKRWSLKRYITFGTFDFHRMAMYNDLDPKNWSNLGEQQTLQDIFSGTGEEDGLTSEEYEVDDEKNQAKVPLLLNQADASQFSAVLEVMDGRNLALQGPPGTGKSQTITNIIGAALAQNKKVLFLADKKAALDVVYKKLVDAGLGEFCLKIPSTNVKKIDVIDDIKKRLDLKSKRINQQELLHDIEKEKKIKGQLINYAKILTTKIGQSEKNIYELNGLRAKYKQYENKIFSELFELGYKNIFKAKSIEDISSQKIQIIAENLEQNEIQSKSIKSKYKNLSSHPWYGFNNDKINPYEKKDFIKFVNKILGYQDALINFIQELKSLQLDECQFIETIDQFNNIKMILKDFEDPKDFYNGIEAVSSVKDLDLVKEFIKQLEEIKPELELEKKVFSLFKFKISDFRKVDKLKKLFDESGFFGSFSSKFREGKKEYLAISKGNVFNKKNAIKNLEIYSKFKKIHKSFIEKKEKIENNQPVKKILGNNFKGINTDNTILKEIFSKIDILTKKFETKSINLLLKDKDIGKSLFKLVKDINIILENIIDSYDNIKQNLDDKFFGDEILHVRFKELFDKLKKLNPEILDEWIAYIQIKKNNSEVENKIIDSFEEKDMEFKDLKQIFFALYYNFLIKKAYELYPNLSNYSGEKLSDLREEFKNLDKTISIRKREDLIQKLNSKKITSGVSYGSTKQLTELGLISRIISQKRPQITLRNLIKKSSLALSQLKPCFMMSPVALAELVRPAEDLFDILIIDEASQMKMEDAIGGLARSKQCVIVGDQQQLAPTDFFDIAADESSDDEDDLIEESILDLAVSRFKPKRMLRWHYRSRNQNLINFSNKFFYDDRLIIPPSPTLKPAIHYNFVKSLYKGRINEQEKDAIAEGLIKFMKSNIRKNENDKSAKSCLVVTMNQEQKELIEDEIRLRENENEIISEYRNSWEGTLEPFEVKNLESVQGDERDCIFISTLFGPNEKGKVLQQFGPINNNTKGHRRLNVLFTRAKKEIYLYTSLQPNDILSENAPQGRVVFKNYIEYAKTGRLEIGDVSEGKEPMSEFEIFVKDGIEKLGYQVDTQVGVSGFYIDLGIKHKKFPDGYILGVECDGRAYHSSKSARDNDILRQSVLEDLGWKIYRIWSTDWFNNPQKELSKLDRYIQKII